MVENNNMLKEKRYKEIFNYVVFWLLLMILLFII